MNVLITGVAGFIGAALAQRLLERGDGVFGIDNLNAYYDVSLERSTACATTRRGRVSASQKLDYRRSRRCGAIVSQPAFRRRHAPRCPGGCALFDRESRRLYRFEILSGSGTFSEGCRHAASHTLSLHPQARCMARIRCCRSPSTTTWITRCRLYAATKKANELMAHSYAHLYRPCRAPVCGFHRLRPVGPSGHGVVQVHQGGILEGVPIPVFNQGRMVRDFTYIDDIVEGVIRAIDRPACPREGGPARSPILRRVTRHGEFTISATNRPVELMRYINVLEQCLGRKAKLDLLPMQAGRCRRHAPTRTIWHWSWVSSPHIGRDRCDAVRRVVYAGYLPLS